VIALDVRDQPLPEDGRLGVRVVDPEGFNALLDPEEDDPLDLVPE
jgi:hypothetical protein